jgi:hypothetical protein
MLDGVESSTPQINQNVYGINIEGVSARTYFQNLKGLTI